MKPIRSEGINIAVPPNPSQGIYTLAYGGLANSEVTIYDCSGKLVYSKILDERQDETFLELANQPNGVYFMIVRDRQSGSLLHNEKLILVKYLIIDQIEEGTPRSDFKKKL